MYRINQSYEGPHLLDLNLIEARGLKKLRISPAEILLTAIPLALMIGLLVIALAPDFGLMAECFNTPEGDVCSIYIR